MIARVSSLSETWSKDSDKMYSMQINDVEKYTGKQQSTYVWAQIRCSRHDGWLCRLCKTLRLSDKHLI